MEGRLEMARERDRERQARNQSIVVKKKEKKSSSNSKKLLQELKAI